MSVYPNTSSQPCVEYQGLVSNSHPHTPWAKSLSERQQLTESSHFTPVYGNSLLDNQWLRSSF